MADIKILNPIDQPTGKWRLINELQSCLSSDEYNTLLVAVAFVKSGPLLRLQSVIDQWLSKKGKIEAIFGVNHRNTSKQALQFALAKFTKTHILFHSEDFTYHPKMYLFIGQTKCRFFIGSHNLTVGGTETNWESGIQMSLELPEDQAILTEGMVAWTSLLDMSTQLTSNIIQQYENWGKLSDESVRRQRTSVIPPGGVIGTTTTSVPPRLKLKIKPPSPLPPDLFTSKLPKRPVVRKRTALVVQGIKREVVAEALVIQIIPHHNGEILLSKKAVDQNPVFFGYPFTGRTTPKKPSNPSYPQLDPDPIVDLKVYSDTAKAIIHHPKIALNTVYYEIKSEIRITVPPEVVRKTPPYSILVIRQAPPEIDCDYEMEIFPPNHPQFKDYLAICNQTLPSGGKKTPRRMGWL